MSAFQFFAYPCPLAYAQALGGFPVCHCNVNHLAGSCPYAVDSMVACVHHQPSPHTLQPPLLRSTAVLALAGFLLLGGLCGAHSKGAGTECDHMHYHV